MTPLQALTPTDYGKLFTPKAMPPVIPPVAATPSPIPPKRNDNTMVYLGLGVVILVVVVGGIYLANQNQQIMQQLTLVNEREERKQLASVTTNSITSKTTNNATKSEPTDKDGLVEKS